MPRKEVKIKIPVRRVSISDVHIADRDWIYDKGNGDQTGMELFQDFTRWAVKENVLVLNLGDFFDFIRKLAEDLKLAKEVLSDEFIRHLILMAGNHDPLQGISFLQYAEEKVFELELLRKIRKGDLLSSKREDPSGPLGVSMENVEIKTKIVQTHGDIFDEFWNPENLEKKSTRRRLWWGQEVIKRGRQAEKVHPDLDNFVLRFGHRLQKRLVKRGERIPDDVFRSRAIAFAKEREADEIITGHSHGPDDTVEDGVRFVNLGSWVPGNSGRSDGFYKIGDIWPGVFDWDRGILYRWMDGGLHLPVLDGDGEWRFKRVS